MPELSRFERITDNIFQRIDKLDKADVTKDIPLGTENVRPNIAIDRFKQMRPKEREKFIQMVGIDKVMKMLGNG